jgi:hypothetical protein
MQGSTSTDEILLRCSNIVCPLLQPGFGICEWSTPKKGAIVSTAILPLPDRASESFLPGPEVVIRFDPLLKPTPSRKQRLMNQLDGVNAR